MFGVPALRAARTAHVADETVRTDFLKRLAVQNRLNGWRYWSAVTEVNGWDLRQIRSGSPPRPAS
jgi:hypothetical protein